MKTRVVADHRNGTHDVFVKLADGQLFRLVAGESITAENVAEVLGGKRAKWKAESV